MKPQYRFSQRSLNNLRGVHPDLVACVVACLYRYTPVDFAVIEGMRGIERQKKLVEAGKSWTMDSYHLMQEDGWGHAVDLAPWINGTIPWGNPKPFEDIAQAMEMAAKYLMVKIPWGGDCKQNDSPHYQLED